MIQDILKNTESKMKDRIIRLKKEFTKIRTGRANPSLVENIKVDYYGNPTQLKSMASISIPESNMIFIQPWDITAIKNIEKAILKSQLGITPNNDGKMLKLILPPLTEERRKELIKLVKKTGEDCKVNIRQFRRESNDLLKKLEKDKEINEDDSRKAFEKIQKTTDKFIDEVKKVNDKKNEEIMSF